MSNLNPFQHNGKNHMHSSSAWTSLMHEPNQNDIRSETTTHWTKQYSIKRSQYTGELKITLLSATDEVFLQRFFINSSESVSLDLSEHNKVLLIEGTFSEKQIQKNQKSIALIKKWMSDLTPGAQETDTNSLKEIMKEIDENRLSERKLFP